MLCHFQNQPGITASHLQGVEDGWEAFIELDVHDGPDDSHNTPVGGGSSSCRCDIVSAWKIMQTCALEAFGTLQTHFISIHVQCLSVKTHRI